MLTLVLSGEVAQLSRVNSVLSLYVDICVASLSAAQETEAKLQWLLQYRRAEADIPSVCDSALVKLRCVKYLVCYIKYLYARFIARPRLGFLTVGPVLAK
jgi:hypothetical protein